jgi:hypothetical protein
MPTIVAYPLSSKDDAQKRFDNSADYNDSSGTLVLGKKFDVSGQSMTVGIRFPNISIPPGATITSATLALVSQYENPSTVSLRVFAENTDSSLPFSSSNDPADRPLTTAFTNWVPAAGSNWVGSGVYNSTPDIGPLIQAVVNRAGWTAGNAITLIIKDNGSTNYQGHSAASVDSGPTTAPKLTVTYSVVAPVTVQTFQTAPKEYLYKVSKPDGTYVGVWSDVTDDPQWTQQINTPGTTTTVFLGRSADNMIERREAWVDQTNTRYADQSGEEYMFVSRTSNTVGPDTDVEYGLNVDIYAVYGGYEPLVDQNGVPYADQTGDSYVVATGAPLGQRVFSGKIKSYKAVYKDREGVEVLLVSHGIELTEGEPIKSGTSTTVTYATTPLDTIVKSILDTNPGKITYNAGSIDYTGVSPTLKFQLNTKLEGIKSAFTQTPEGFYWYVDIGENVLYMKQNQPIVNHVFIKGRHLSEVNIERSGENLRNRIYFVGGDTGSGVLYKVYEDAAAIADFGLATYRITDRRFTVAAHAQRYAQKVLSRYARPVYTSTITVPSSVYNIEDIKLGHNIAFRNFGNFIDTQVLQAVSISYTPYAVTIQLGEVLDDQKSIIADLDEGLSNEQYQDIPNAPS